MEEKRIFELTGQLKKAGHYELAHFLIGQLANDHLMDEPHLVTVTVLIDAHLGHELLEIRSKANPALAEVVPLSQVDSTWLYYHMACGHILSESRNGRSWGVTATPAQAKKIDPGELTHIIDKLYPPGINNMSPVAIPELPEYKDGDSCGEMVRKAVAHYLGALLDQNEDDWEYSGLGE